MGRFISIGKKKSATDFNQIHTDKICLRFMAEIGAIILAAGSGSRMGRTKQLLKIDGETLVRRAVLTAAEAGLRPIVVVTGADSETVECELNELEVTVAFNPTWARGMGSSIRCGIAALLKANPAIDGAAILLCDQPRVTSDLLRRLIVVFRESGKGAVACEYGGSVGPPCFFGPSTFGELVAIPDEQGAKKVLMANPARLTRFAWPEGVDDIDTPSDWQREIGEKS
jgi:molybdenum cofactor cytidylyltransferase